MEGFNNFDLLQGAVLFGITTLCIYMYVYFKSKHSLVVKVIQNNYDYIVIGAGSAGAVLASRLSENPNNSVLLLEAGDEDTSNSATPVPLAAFSLQKTEMDWQYKTEPQTHMKDGQDNDDFRFAWPRGKVLGGTSILNTMQYARGSKHDYDEWESNGCDKWGYKDVLPYFLKSEDISVPELKSSKYHNVGGPLGVSQESGPLVDMFINGGKELGFDEVDYNGESQIGFSGSQVNVRNGKRASTASEFLRPIMGRPNLNVAVNAHAAQIYFDGNVAKSVKFYRDGFQQTVFAIKEIILSAGAIGSPQLLMLSGIGPRDHLERLNIKVIENLPVGQNLQDHMEVVIPTRINTNDSVTATKASSIATVAKYLIAKKGLLASTNVPGIAFVRSDNYDKLYPDIQFQLFAALPRIEDLKFGHTRLNGIFPMKEHEGFTLCAVLLHPKSRGTIRLKSTDPFDDPIIDPNYLSEEEDMHTLLKAIRLGEKLFCTTAFKSKGVTLDLLKKWEHKNENDVGSDKFYEHFIRKAAISAYHPTSTCRMGPTDELSTVVDSQLRVKGLQRIRVVDASIMPNVVSGNINAPVIMIAEKAADMILGVDTVKEIRERLDNN